MHDPAWTTEQRRAGPPVGGQRAFSMSAPTLRRASNALSVDPAVVLTHAQNAPRFDPQGMLVIEGQFTNSAFYTRGEGAVVGALGAGGMHPTGWGFSGGAGLNVSIESIREEAGINFIAYKFAGTATATNFTLAFGAYANSPALQNDVFTAGVFLRTLAGASPAAALRMRAENFDEGGANLNPVPATMTRHQRTREYTEAQASIGAGARAQLRIAGFSVGQAMDWTWEIGGPSWGKGFVPNTPPLPPAGAPGVATRLEDRVTAVVGAVGAIGLKFLLPTLPVGSTAVQMVAQLDAGTDAARIYVAVDAAGNLTAYLVTDATYSVALGTIAAGELVALLLRYTAAGITLHRAGWGTAAYVGAIPAGINTLRLANRADWTAPGDLRVATVDIYDGLDPAQAPAALAAL